jgi:hypothetical protein
VFKKLCPLLAILTLSLAAAGSESPPGEVELTEEERTRFSDLPPYPRGLIDIESFKVTVAKPSEEAAHWGLTERVIRKTVELRLKGAGVRFVKEGTPESDFTPTLYIDVSTGKVNELHAFVVGLTVSVDRKVLIRPRGYPVEAQVWDAGYTGIVHTRNLVEVVKENLRTYIDDLVTEYFMANPKSEASD